MPIRGGEQAAEFALAALLRGAAEFAHRAEPAGTPAETLARFASARLSWLVSTPTESRALQAALDSYVPQGAGGRLLDAAWRFGSSSEPNKPVDAGGMRYPLSTVFRASTEKNGPLVPLVRLALKDSISFTSKYSSGGRMKLALNAAFEALEAASDGLGRRFIEDSQIKKLLSSRNDSILAHGQTPISERTARDLRERVLFYLPPDFSFPRFPTLSL